MPGEEALTVQGLNITLHERDQEPLPLVEDVGFTLRSGRMRALVGESGCGKSLTAKALMDVLPEGMQVSGEAFLEGTDILRLGSKEHRRLNGQRIALIPQDPMTALNPVLKVGYQIAEGLRYHHGVSRRAAVRTSRTLCQQVGIPEDRNILEEYPHQLSGGMQQRVVIATMLACRPLVMLADEPTTALDVRVQRQLLELLRDIAHETGTAFLLVTHDLGVVAETCEEVTVMYAGRVVEEGSVDRVLASPQHPYTAGLLSAVPRRAESRIRLTTIPGTVPPPGTVDAGCRFRDRCERRADACAVEPQLQPAADADPVRCWFPYAREGSEHETAG